MKNKKPDIALKEHVFTISGELNFHNVMSVFEKSLEILHVKKKSRTKTYIFDFAKVTNNDSSAIALLIEWLRLAKKKELRFHFQNLSDDMLTIIKVAQLDEFLYNSNNN